MDTRPTRKHYDVLIVGARCAGAATAMLLARAGLRVLAIDKAAYGADALSTHALMRGAVLQLARWGLLDVIRAAETPAIRSTTFYYGERRLDVDIEPKGEVDALYAPRRTVLDRLLVDAARAAGAEVRHKTRLLGVVRNRDGRVDTALVGSGGAVHHIGADLIIGADGARSMFAELVGAPFERRGDHAATIAYSYWSGLDAGGYQWYYERDLSAGIIPTNGGQWCVFVGVPRWRKNALAADMTGWLEAAAPELARTLSRGRPESGLRRFAGMPGFLRRAHGPGWALVGDAGYFRDPLTAHGITDALRDAELCARAVIRGGDGALAEYQTQRDEVSTAMFEITERIASFDWDLDEVAELHREQAFAMRPELRLLGALDPLDPIAPNAAA